MQLSNHIDIRKGSNILRINNKAYSYQQDCNTHNKVWYDGISLALSGTAKHKCRAPLKFKWRLEQRYQR